jgi:hypothetical protein
VPGKVFVGDFAVEAAALWGTEDEDIEDDAYEEGEHTNTQKEATPALGGVFSGVNRVRHM